MPRWPSLAVPLCAALLLVPPGAPLLAEAPGDAPEGVEPENGPENGNRNGTDAEPEVKPQAETEDAAMQEAMVLWQQGYFLHLSGNYPIAAAFFRASIAAHPTAEGHTFLGWSLSHMGRLEEAIEECRRAIEIDPDFGNPYNDIAVYLIELGRLEEALRYLEDAIQAPRYCCYHFAHTNMGRVLVMKGRFMEAEDAFRRALRHEPGYAPALQALALLRERGQPL